MPYGAVRPAIGHDEPAAQSVQSPSEPPPALVLYVPGGQYVGAVDGAGQYAPGGQVIHELVLFRPVDGL